MNKPLIFKGYMRPRTPWTVRLPIKHQPDLRNWSWHPTWADALTAVRDYYKTVK